METRVVEERSAAPAPPLAGLVSGYTGSRCRGLAPGLHRGLPTHHLGLVISLGQPIRLAGMPDRTQPPGAFRALVHGLQTGPALIMHEGSSLHRHGRPHPGRCPVVSPP